MRLLSILDLTDDTCRWPIGDPKEPGFGFCGCAVKRGSRYCQEHYDQSRSRPQVEQQPMEKAA